VPVRRLSRGDDFSSPTSSVVEFRDVDAVLRPTPTCSCAPCWECTSTTTTATGPPPSPAPARSWHVPRTRLGSDLRRVARVSRISRIFPSSDGRRSESHSGRK
jgi:hypothetical protein